MLSPFLKRVYIFTLLLTISSTIIFLTNRSNIEISETIMSIMNIYLILVLPILICYIIWKWIRDGFIKIEKIIIMFLNSIVYTILSIDILISLFYLISIVKI